MQSIQSAASRSLLARPQGLPCILSRRNGTRWRLSRPKASQKSYSSPSAAAALSGIRVLDLSRVLAGPYCAQILADYGADVIKIEDPERGDDTRYIRLANEEAAWKPNIGPMSVYFAVCNRNKRSVRLNLKHARGKEIFLDMVKDADILIENFKRGSMEKLGLGFDVLSEINPRLIFASVSGYGPDGPYAQRAGYDMITEAGLLHLQGERDRAPVKAGIAITDLTTGLYMHGAILAALQARHHTGRGQKLDGSLFETQIALLTQSAMAWLNLGQEAQRWGSQHSSVVPYDAFKTKDIYLVCGAVNDVQFKKFCTILGQPELASDERFKNNYSRVMNRDELNKILKGLFLLKTTDEWLEAFDGSGLPYGAINTMERVFKHPQTAARDMVVEMPFEPATSGKFSLLGPAVKFSDTEPTIRRPPPLHGQHTDEVLADFGVGDAEINKLRQEGVI
ncbi:CoA-transferase family III domain-containing protein [Neohortaea acidophila]|uniref:CoA-transferase family III domain-containing protein n=1 Tax=Neohortaea acidophila TaxID=245834 RepID=A0A6A6Q2I4_9PEZI|nr:CoA-transferase family III domain-containing protein [Neohortaea acidophila]KAF2486204.1 CoA-transferase family III domain-containing protein [Neohortaea acidophila]